MNKLIVFILTVATVLGIQNQATAQSAFIGYRGGMNFNHVNSHNNSEIFENQKTQKGANFGAVIGFNFNNNLSFQSEVLYARKGYQVTNGSETIAKTNFDYLQIPVMAKVSFGCNRFKMFANAGAYSSYLLKASGYEKQQIDETVSGPRSGDTRSNDINLDKPVGKYSTTFNRFDAGLIGGIGASLKVGSGNVFVEGRYEWGFNDIYTVRKHIPLDYAKTTHNTMGVSVGYILPIKTKAVAKEVVPEIMPDVMPLEPTSVAPTMLEDVK